MNAQTEDHSHIHNDFENDHYHKKNELGIAISPVYFINENEFTYGIHLHYVRTIGESKFGIGLEAERIFDEHRHNTIGFSGSYRPVHPLSFSLSPGISFEGSDFSENHFSMHIETAYEFETKFLHLGPSLELGFSKEDLHISLGLHLGFGF